MSCSYCFHCMQEEAKSRDQTLVPWGKTILVLEQGENLIQFYDEGRQSTIMAIVRKDGSQYRLQEIFDAVY